MGIALYGPPVVVQRLSGNTSLPCVGGIAFYTCRLHPCSGITL